MKEILAKRQFKSKVYLMVLFDRSWGFKWFLCKWFEYEVFDYQLKSSGRRRHVFSTIIYDGLVRPKTTEEDFSLELYIFIPNMNFKWLEEILFLFMHELLYFKDVQPRNNVRIS